MISSQYSKSEKKALNPPLDEFHPRSDRNGRVNQLSSDLYNGASKTSSRRRFPSSWNSKTSHKVVLEVPLQYSFADGRKDASGKHEGWKLRQMSRLSLNSSFPIVATPLRYQNNARSDDYLSSILRKVTCQFSASTAMRGRTGYSTGSIQMQYRHQHNCDPSRLEPLTTQTPENQRWASTLTAGFGFHQLEHSNDESDAPAGMNTARALPFPVFHLGCSTSVSHAEASTSTSFSANVQTPKLGRVVLPLTVSSQQRLKFQSSKAPDVTRSLDMRSQCTTIFDFSTRSSKLKVPTINATVSFSPTVKTKDISLRRKDGRVLHHWSFLLGLNKQKGEMKPLIGVSMTLQLPKLLRGLWKTVRNHMNDNILDFTLQWKGGSSWQMNGWWIQKQMANFRKASPSPQRPIRQIGVGVNFNHSSTRRGSSSKLPVSTFPLGILSWIITWTEGDFTFRIPILFSDIALDSIWYHQGFQIFYLSFLSSIIQDVVGQFMGHAVVAEEGADSETKNDPFTQMQNARNDAILQQKLMERPARMRTALEVERNGLVIRQAVLFVEFEDAVGTSYAAGKFSEALSTLKDTEYLDVTVPLQFWLSSNESKLLLHGKRSSMLGFYDLAAHYKSLNGDPKSRQVTPSLSERAAIGETPEKSSIWEQFLSIFLIEPQNHGANGGIESVPTNKLWIKYDFGGNSYEITVSDTEDIEIPNLKAKQIVQQL